MLYVSVLYLTGYFRTRYWWLYRSSCRRRYSRSICKNRSSKCVRWFESMKKSYSGKLAYFRPKNAFASTMPMLANFFLYFHLPIKHSLLLRWAGNNFYCQFPWGVTPMETCSLLYCHCFLFIYFFIFSHLSINIYLWNSYFEPRDSSLGKNYLKKTGSIKEI